MGERLLFILLLLAPGTLVLRAQDYPVPVVDGPALSVKEDSLSVQPHSYSLMEFSPAIDIRLPSTLAPPPFETKEQKAARINLRAEADVMRSMHLNLMGYQPPRFSLTEKRLLRFAGMFFSDPFKLPDGCVPFMNTTNPFLFFMTPGRAPYEHLYSPDVFPQWIRTEYDFASGTYRQVAQPWNVISINGVRSFGGPYRNAPVPKMSFTAAERALVNSAPAN